MISRGMAARRAAQLQSDQAVLSALLSAPLPLRIFDL